MTAPGRSPARRAAWVGIALLAAACTAPPGAPGPDHLIAHALGGIDGRTYTNSREAFLAAHRAGFRLFEADLVRTGDGHLVLSHEGGGEGADGPAGTARMTRDAFLARPLEGGLTPLDLAGLLALVAERPGVRVVTDFKCRRGCAGYFAAIVATARAVDPALLDRIIPQIYRPADYDRVMRLHRFPTLIYTLYRTPDDDTRVVAFVRGHPEVRIVTMSRERFSPALARDLDRLGVEVFVHTVNDPAEADRFRRQGADGFYTDFLRPAVR